MEIYQFEKGHLKERTKIDLKNPTWIDLRDPTDEDISIVSKKLDIPGFVLRSYRESYRPRVEIYQDYTIVNVKSLATKKITPMKSLRKKQITFFISKKFVLTMHKGAKEIDNIKEKALAKENSKSFKNLNFLTYSILDEVIEGFGPVLESIDDHIDRLQDLIFEEAKQEHLEELFDLKRTMVKFHKVLWAQREAMFSLSRGAPGIDPDNVMYFRELYDSILYSVDREELLREMLTEILDSYLSVVSNNMNEVIKVLTVMATIMLPLTLITGIYGMNFRNMPEIYWEYGYYITLGIMATLGISMWMYFKRRGWV